MWHGRRGLDAKTVCGGALTLHARGLSALAWDELDLEWAGSDVDAGAMNETLNFGNTVSLLGERESNRRATIEPRAWGKR